MPKPPKNRQVSNGGGPAEGLENTGKLQTELTEATHHRKRAKPSRANRNILKYGCFLDLV